MLPFPRPSAILDLSRSAAGRVVGSATSFVAIPARAFGVLDSIEALVRRINVVVDRAEELLDRTAVVLDEAERAVTQVGVISAAATVAVDEATRVASAAGVVVAEAERVSAAAGAVVAGAGQVSAGAGGVIAEAEMVTGRAAAAVARAELVAATADELLTAYDATLRKGVPIASRFVEQLSAEEVDAAIRLVDELPKLTNHLTSDVLPMLATLDRVGPDIHDLLEVTRDLKLAVAGIPGLKLLRRRGEERLADEAAAEAGAAG